MRFVVVSKDQRLKNEAFNLLKSRFARFEKKYPESTLKAVITKGKGSSVALKIILRDSSNKVVFVTDIVDGSLLEAIATAEHLLQEHIKKQWDILNKKAHKVIKLEPAKPSLPSWEDEIQIRKKIDPKPMTEKEAILQLKNFNKNELLFYNADTERVCLLTKDKDKFILFET